VLSALENDIRRLPVARSSFQVFRCNATRIAGLATLHAKNDDGTRFIRWNATTRARAAGVAAARQKRMDR
jgi:hypothetical protein